jgi:hypothetical protein
MSKKRVVAPQLKSYLISEHEANILRGFRELETVSPYGRLVALNLVQAIIDETRRSVRLGKRRGGAR